MPILNESELDWLCENVPNAPRSPKGGRPPADKRLMLQAIFWVLDNGAKWKDLPSKLGSKSTAHRWFRTWAQAGVFEELMNVAGLCIEEKEGFKVEMIAPHRRNRRAENVTQDARPLRRYRRRWKVERTIAWLQHFRRLCIRWEKSSLLFQGFVHFACTMLLLREVLG